MNVLIRRKCGAAARNSRDRNDLHHNIPRSYMARLGRRHRIRRRSFHGLFRARYHHRNIQSCGGRMNMAIRTQWFRRTARGIGRDGWIAILFTVVGLGLGILAGRAMFSEPPRCAYERGFEGG